MVKFTAGAYVSGESSRRRPIDCASVAVTLHGARAAVVSTEGSVTYRELDGLARELASDLGALGIARDDLVALALPRSVALVAAVLGVATTGAAYVALDPLYPKERVSFMLRDSGAAAVIEASDDPLRPAVRRLDQSEPHQVYLPGDSDEPAYVVYTSGSTGRPKGVVVGQGALLGLIEWHVAEFGLTHKDKVTLIASPGFDASVWEMWPALVAGASLHIVPEQARLDPRALRDWLVHEGITVSFVPTPLAERLIDLDWPAASLRVLLTGGDVLLSRPPAGLPFALVNNYGVSEAAVVSTSTVITADPAPAAAPPIGVPVAGAQLYVVDESLRPVPAGTPGELLIGGAGVALGYINRPAETTERFIPDHLSGGSGRLFRTGDIVREVDGGRFEFVGRMDDQAQILGTRVECGEVSAALIRHPDVGQCAVVAAGQPGRQRLIAYLVATDGIRPTSAAVRSWLEEILPLNMVPSEYTWVDALPIGANGKIDRAALTVSPPTGADPGGVDAAAPVGDLEAEIAAIVGGVLGLEAIGRNQDFFLLGGHSLLAAQLIACLDDAFGVQVSLRSVFEGPTVREISGEVERLILSEVEELSDEEADRLLAELAD